MGEDSKILKRVIFVLSYFVRLANRSEHLSNTNIMNSESGENNQLDNSDKNIPSDIKTIPLNSIMYGKETFENCTTKLLQIRKNETNNISTQDSSLSHESNQLQKKVSFTVGATSETSNTTIYSTNSNKKESLQEDNTTACLKTQQALMVSLPNTSW